MIDLKPTKFKDEKGRWRIRMLFAELMNLRVEQERAVFGKGEAGKIFVELNDPTGYKFATEYLGGWKHWIALLASPQVGPLIASWQDELDIKLRCLGVENMVKLAKGEKGYQASKFLLDGGWKQKTTGRPTKKSIEKETKIQAKLYDEFSTVVDINRKK